MNRKNRTTKRTTHWAERTSALAAVVVAVLGCSGEAAGPTQFDAAQGAAEGEWEVSERAYVGEHGQLVCSERRWNAAGQSTVVEREFYRLDVMNAALEGKGSLDSGVRAAALAAGITRVDDCDGARRFIRLQTDHLESQPTAPPFVPEEGPLDDSSVPSNDEAISVKIAEGRTWYDPPTVQIRPTDQQNGCSGVLINPAMMLTSAHCFPGDGQYRRLVNYGSQKLDALGNRICINSGGCNPPAGNNVLVWLHPSWLGSGDTGHDLALVFHTKGGWIAPANTSASWLPLLESDAAVRSQLFWNVGYGANDHSGTGGGVGRLSNDQSWIDWSGAHHWVAITQRFRGRPCSGDSGSPSINWDLIGEGLVIGIISNGEARPGQFCPDPGMKYRATNVTDKLDWIVDTVGHCRSRFWENGVWYRKCWE